MIRALLLSAATVALAACSPALAAAPGLPATAPVVKVEKKKAEKTPPEFHKVVKDKTGAVEAHFDGETPPPELKAPLQFGTSRLWFTFANDKTAYAFKPAGDLEFTDWFFDVFSPSGEYVLLPQDHYGPFHVVAVKNLKAYLEGKAQPEKILQEKIAPGQQALVHMDAKWVAPDEIEYKVGGETPEVRRQKI